MTGLGPITLIVKIPLPWKVGDKIAIPGTGDLKQDRLSRLLRAMRLADRRGPDRLYTITEIDPNG